MKTPKINIGKLLNQINSFGNDAKRMAVAITNSTADSIVADAKQRAPVNFGQLRLSIAKTDATIQLNRSLIFSNAPYSAFVEFGTGSKVKVPPGFEKLASEFKGKGGGSFDDFLDNIRDWCKKKGIDEKVAYPIAVSILRTGIKPQPYFIPAYLVGVASYAKKLSKSIEIETKKYNAKK
jgi:HK97 gp10 family phage protein